MATARLVASTYDLSSTTYLSVSNADDMYDDTDSSTYGTVTNSQRGTTSYYIYLRGFDFSQIPSGATVTSFKVKLKARESGGNTSSSYAPKLCNGTSQITSTCTPLTTTASVHEFTNVDADWDDIVGYGSNFGIRINCRRASRNTTAYIYIYGAEIEVTYTIANPVDVTSSLNGDGTIDPSGTTTLNEGDEYTLTITPTNKSDQVTLVKDGTDISSELVAHGSSGSDSNVLGTYHLVSGGFNGSGATYFQGLVGKGEDGSQTTSNYYSSSSNTQAVFQYDVGFDIPSNAVIESLYARVNGHAESTSQSSEYMCVQLKSGNTDISEEINFKNVSTSNTTITLEATTIPTVAQLADLVLECTLGYYGGAINGATVYLTYSIPGSSVEYYTYTFIANADAVLVVTIGAVEGNKLYLKTNSGWVEVVLYANGSSWASVQDPLDELSNLMNYILEEL